MVGVLGVNTVFADQRDPRNLQLEFFVLFKKRLGKIKITRMLPCIPRIRPPTRRTVDFVGARGRIDRHGAFAAKITCTTIERALIPPRISSLLPALRTPRGRRDFYSLIKARIVGLDGEKLGTVFTSHVSFHLILLVNSVDPH